MRILQLRLERLSFTTRLAEKSRTKHKTVSTPWKKSESIFPNSKHYTDLKAGAVGMSEIKLTP